MLRLRGFLIAAAVLAALAAESTGRKGQDAEAKKPRRRRPKSSTQERPDARSRSAHNARPRWPRRRRTPGRSPLPQPLAADPEAMRSWSQASPPLNADHLMREDRRPRRFGLHSPPSTRRQKRREDSTSSRR